PPRESRRRGAVAGAREGVRQQHRHQVEDGGYPREGAPHVEDRGVTVDRTARDEGDDDLPTPPEDQLGAEAQREHDDQPVDEGLPVPVRHPQLPTPSTVAPSTLFHQSPYAPATSPTGPG